MSIKRDRFHRVMCPRCNHRLEHDSTQKAPVEMHCEGCKDELGKKIALVWAPDDMAEAAHSGIKRFELRMERAGAEGWVKDPEPVGSPATIQSSWTQPLARAARYTAAATAAILFLGAATTRSADDAVVMALLLVLFLLSWVDRFDLDVP